MRGVSQACALGELCAALPPGAARGIVSACLSQLSLLCQRLLGRTVAGVQVRALARYRTSVSGSKSLPSTASRPKLLVDHGMAVGSKALRRALPNLRYPLTSRDTASRARYRHRQQHSTYRRATPGARSCGSALLVYEGDFDTSLDAATGERNLATQAALAGQLSAALDHAKRAVELAPASAMAHRNLCMLLAPTRVDSALEECNAARNLFLNDPLRDEKGRKYYLDSVERSLTALKR